MTSGKATFKANSSSSSGSMSFSFHSYQKPQETPPLTALALKVNRLDLIFPL